MGVTRKSVLRWSPVVDAELVRANVPLPRDLILAIIDVESRGVPGLTNPKSGASGLMQIMPGTLNSYNDAHSSAPISIEELRSSGAVAAVAQIRVGLWVLATYWKSAYKYLAGRLSTIPIDELSRIADLFYVAGPGATRRRLDKLSVPSWGGLQAAFPSWNALPHPRNVFAHFEDLQWPIEAIQNWVTTEGSILEDPKTGLAVAVAGILVAWWFMRDRKGKDQ
jgi:hypothetical protein